MSLNILFHLNFSDWKLSQHKEITKNVKSDHSQIQQRENILLS